MVDIKFVCALILLFYTNISICDNIHTIRKRVEEHNNLSIQMYGRITDQYEEYNLGYYNLNNFLYPRGDKHKLVVLASLWHKYYECCLQSLSRLTSRLQVPSVLVMVYVGAVARLPCSVCIAPNERGMLQWVYSESSPNSTFAPLQDLERKVVGEENLTIYNVKISDAGVYRCQIGSTRSVAVLEVIDNKDYNVVKPETSRGPYPRPAVHLHNGLTVFSSWSPWSECSVCGKVGRRRRYGVCYVKLNQTLPSNMTISVHHGGHPIILNDREIDLFEVFPDGIPCRSKYLPIRLRLPIIVKRRSEIMIAMCKVPCNNMIYLSRTLEGYVVEIANNTAGIYSLEQLLPKQPPIPVRDTLFVDFGQAIHVRCPGTTLRDVPIVWRSGAKVIVPRELDQMSGGRVYLNSRDHLVFTKVLYRDSSLYSCWEQETLAGAVCLRVREGVTSRGRQRLLLLALLLAAAVLLRLTTVLAPIRY